MKDGFLKVACVTPKVKLGNPDANATNIIEHAKAAALEGARIIAFPELSISGYSCRDLFLNENLISKIVSAVERVVEETRELDALIVFGAMLESDNKLFDCAILAKSGVILGVVPKEDVSKDSFAKIATNGSSLWNLGLIGNHECMVCGRVSVYNEKMRDLHAGVEIGSDMFLLNNPATAYMYSGTTIIVNPYAGPITFGSDDELTDYVKMLSKKMKCVYMLAAAGEGESTQDEVYGGGSVICECGKVLAKATTFSNETIFATIDLNRIAAERKNDKFPQARNDEVMGPSLMDFEMEEEEVELPKDINRFPFIEETQEGRVAQAYECLDIQAFALKRRMEQIGSKHPVIGISGGLDSTLALLVCAKTADLLGIERKDIIAVTMPCFGTTDRTYNNACRLTNLLGATLKEISIKDAVSQHFKDIEQDMDKHDAAFENAQARERTQVLMDIANQCGGLVVGTGDLSELALGWATYNGDHMSMYAVNADIPKTLMRSVLKVYADEMTTEEIAAIIRDVIDTPVSPELLPAKNGEIAQKTEDLVGPYELHDFFLYYTLKFGFKSSKILRMAKAAFAGEFSNEVIEKWLGVFEKRFITQQYKRSCMPDGPKVGSVGLSPRGDLDMPTDACKAIWLKDLESIKVK